MGVESLRAPQESTRRGSIGCRRENGRVRKKGACLRWVSALEGAPWRPSPLRRMSYLRWMDAKVPGAPGVGDESLEAR